MDPGPAPRSDAELLAAWGLGDRVAATELVDRYYRSVLRFFDLRVGGAAEDLTQRTFLACVEGRERLREAESFRPFLFGIARRLLLNHLRTRVVESNVFDDGDVSSATDPTPTASRIVAGFEQQTLLLRAMQVLDVEAQMLLVLFYWEGLKTSEISEVLGAPVSTVTTRLSRTRKALHDAIAALPAVPGSRDSLLADLDAWLGSVRGLALG
ncbi:MAG: sigma-70 family RNA polymerase sigma factor [Nannocystaceae bacterium]